MLRLLLSALLALLVACASAPPLPQPSEDGVAQPAAVPAVATDAIDPGLIPVTSKDAVWGDPLAPVTVVMFADFECRYCGDAAKTLEALKEKYGDKKLRFAFKHLPLDMHDNAYALAVFSEALRARSGDAAFWDFYRMVFLERNEGESPAQAVGRALSELQARSIPRDLGEGATASGAEKVDLDIELGERLGIRGTPAFFVNGVFISGAQPQSRFEATIDAELVAVAEAAAGGAPLERMYAARTATNREAADASAKREALVPEVDRTVWYAPVGTSPVKGKADALVTIVVFSDFECPFCAKAQKTLARVEKKYGDEVRLVFKHNPLPFHKSAAGSAQLTQEIFVKKGAQAFWAAHDSIFQLERPTDERDVTELATAAGLDPSATAKAVTARKHASAIEADQELASELEADGTPTFFVNGQRITGARSFDEFTSVIDERLAAAKAMVDAGTPRAKVYDEIMKTAKRADPPQKLAIGAPPKNAPKRGAGPVIIQVFSDFECPFCRRHAESLRQVEKAFPGQVTLVFRHLPLPMHKNAWPAATAALEARTQRGDAGFWKMHDALFEAQTERKLGRAGLEELAAGMKLDAKKIAGALDDDKYDAVIKSDVEAADKLGIDGTPATFVDDYFVSGAVSAPKLKRVVRLAIEDRKKK